MSPAPSSDPDAMYVGLNDRDKAWHDLYRVRISSGERTLLRKNTERISNWTFDLSGKLRLASRSPENGDTEILRVERKRAAHRLVHPEDHPRFERVVRAAEDRRDRLRQP